MNAPSPNLPLADAHKLSRDAIENARREFRRWHRKSTALTIVLWVSVPTIIAAIAAYIRFHQDQPAMAVIMMALGLGLVRTLFLLRNRLLEPPRKR